MIVDMDKYNYVGEIELDGVLTANSPVIDLPAGFSPKKHTILLRSTLNKASSIQLVGGITPDFSDMAVDVETAVALGAGHVTPTAGMIHTESTFQCYRLAGTVIAPAATAGSVEVYYGPFSE